LASLATSWLSEDATGQVVVDSTQDVVWLDWNSDGNLDLATVSDGDPNAIYLYDPATAEFDLCCSFGTGDNSVGIAAGDYDADGDVDLAVANGAGGAALYENVAGNPFLSWTSPTLAVPTQAVAWADVDGDGDLDLTLGNDSGLSTSPALQIYENQGGSGPAAFVLFVEALGVATVQDLAWGMTLGGASLGVVAATSGGADLLYYLSGSPGNQSLSQMAIGAGSDSRSVAWGDLDDDGDLDVVVGTADAGLLFYYVDGLSPPELVQWTGTGGSGNFLSAPMIHSVDLADWDGDGDLDVLAGAGVTPHGPSINPSQVNAVVVDNDGGRIWTEAWVHLSTIECLAAGWGDADGDARVDAFITRNGDSDVFLTGSGGVPRDEPLGATMSLVPSQAQGLGWGDFDGDGWIDLARVDSPGSLTLYRNAPVAGSSERQLVVHVSSANTVTAPSSSLAWGDYDGDGDLDLAVGNRGSSGHHNHLYENTGSGLSILTDSNGNPQSPIQIGTETEQTTALAWADFDLDGDLDLATAGTGSPVRVYRQVAGVFSSSGGWSSGANVDGEALAWGDVNQDGFPDLAVGGTNFPVCVYLTQPDAIGGPNLSPTCDWEASGEPADLTYALAWGDWDGDSDLDLVVGNDQAPLRVYAGDGATLTASPVWETASSHRTGTLSLGDWNGDGFLDVIQGNSLADDDQILLGTGSSFETLGTLETGGASRASDLADFDGDGDLDLVLGNSTSSMEFYENYRLGAALQPNTPTSVRVLAPDGETLVGAVVATPLIGGSAGVSPVVTGPTAEVEFSLIDLESDSVLSIELQYALFGGGEWTSATVLSPSLGPWNASPEGTQHSLTWDLTADGVNSEMVRLRVVIEAQWPQWNPAPMQHAAISGESPPFRVFECFPLDADADGFACWEDCDDDDGTVYPGAPEFCDATDSDCDGDLMDGGGVDGDGDGVPSCGDADCDDTDSSIYPGAPEIPDDGIDQDCDGLDSVSCYEDLDGDTFGSAVLVFRSGTCSNFASELSGDCDDDNGAINPGQIDDPCTLVDSDCDGDLIEGAPNLDGDDLPDCLDDDADGDGQQPPLDCDDQDETVFDGAPELCEDVTQDPVDNDCDGSFDDADEDTDEDGETPCEGDCNDLDAEVHSGAVDHPGDGIDQDCDGADAVECFDDVDQDGWGGELLSSGGNSCTEGVQLGGDCDDTDPAVYPGAEEICDGVDTDCDPSTTLPTPDVDLDEDGVEACAGDCNDADPWVYPGATELCDGEDNDCDPRTAALNGEGDFDGDGVISCDDCNDDDPELGHVGVREVCGDGEDTNCNGLPDELEMEECAAFLDDDRDSWCFSGRDFNNDADCMDPGELLAFDGSEGDCMEGDPLVFPGAPEVCGDEVDQDCDGSELTGLRDPDCWPTGCAACSVSAGARAGPLSLTLAVGCLLLLLPRRRREGARRAAGGGLLALLGVVLPTLAFLLVPASAEAKKVDKAASIAEMISAGQCGAARELGLAWTTSSPEAPEAWKGLGNAHRCLGQTFDAVRAYRTYARLGGSEAQVLGWAEALSKALGSLEVNVQRAAFPAQPSLEVRIAGEVIAPVSEKEWFRFRDLRTGEPITIRAGGAGFRSYEAVEEGLLSGEERTLAPKMVWVGAGRIDLAPTSRGDLKVEVLGGFHQVELKYGEPLQVTTGPLKVLLTTSEGQREVEVNVPRGELFSFDPHPHLPSQVMISRLPAGARARLFIEGEGDAAGMHELVLSGGDSSTEVDEVTGVWIAPPQVVPSLLGGGGGLFVSHPVLGSGSQDILLVPGEASSLVFDPETLEGTAAVKESYAAWLQAKKQKFNQIEAPRNFGFAMLIGGAATAGVLGALAAGIPSSGLETSSLAAKDAAARGDLDGISEAWVDYEHALQMRRALVTGAGVSAGVGLIGFSVGFGLSKSRKAVVVPPWEPWSQGGGE